MSLPWFSRLSCNEVDGDSSSLFGQLPAGPRMTFCIAAISLDLPSEGLWPKSLSSGASHCKGAIAVRQHGSESGGLLEDNNRVRVLQDFAVDRRVAGLGDDAREVGLLIESDEGMVPDVGVVRDALTSRSEEAAESGQIGLAVCTRAYEPRRSRIMCQLTHLDRASRRQRGTGCHRLPWA